MHYPNIDMEKTGMRMQKLIKESGYTVKQVQEYLHLSCPQPIYRWFKGQVLPSLNHVYALSALLCVHMEDMLVARPEDRVQWMLESVNKPAVKRYLIYYYRINQAA